MQHANMQKHKLNFETKYIDNNTESLYIHLNVFAINLFLCLKQLRIYLWLNSYEYIFVWPYVWQGVSTGIL